MTITTRPAKPQWDQDQHDPWALPTREEMGDRVMLDVLDAIEYGRSQVLTKDQLLVIKSYVDEMFEEN